MTHSQEKHRNHTTLAGRVGVLCSRSASDMLMASSPGGGASQPSPTKPPHRLGVVGLVCRAGQQPHCWMCTHTTALCVSYGTVGSPRRKSSDGCAGQPATKNTGLPSPGSLTGWTESLSSTGGRCMCGGHPHRCSLADHPMSAREDTASGKFWRLWAPQYPQTAKRAREAPGGLGDLMHMERPTELKHINQWRK